MGGDGGATAAEAVVDSLAREPSPVALPAAVCRATRFGACLPCRSGRCKTLGCGPGVAFVTRDAEVNTAY